MRSLIALGAIALALAAAGCGSSGSQGTGPVRATPTIQALPAAASTAQPPAAASVAASLRATGFTDCGPAPMGGVTDSGTAYLGRERIGINTFPGSDIRDQWEKTARGFGVVPFMTGADWVAYESIRQSAKGCD